MYVQMYTTLERQLCRYFINVKQFLIFLYVHLYTYESIKYTRI